MSDGKGDRSMTVIPKEASSPLQKHDCYLEEASLPLQKHDCYLEEASLQKHDSYPEKGILRQRSS